MKRWLIDHLPATLLALLALVVFASLVTCRYYNFAYDDWDMAFYSQQLWGLIHGKFYSSLFGFHVFGSHAEFFNLFTLPVFAIFPYPLTFSFIQVFFFAAAALLLYRISLDEVDRRTAFLIMIIYLIMPANVFGMCHDHNPESMSPFFFLWAFYSFRKKILWSFYVSCFFLFTIKENMPLIVFMFGLWGLCSKDRNRWLWGGVPALFSVASFLLLVKFVIPHFRGMQQHSLWVRFSHIGNSPTDILLGLLHWDTLKIALLNQANGRYLVDLFGPLVVPAAITPWPIALISPFLLYHLLSQHPPEKTIFFYYGLILTPAILIATALTLKRFFSALYLRHIVAGALLLLMVVHGGSFYERFVYKVGFSGCRENSGKWSLVKKIPNGAPVVATFSFLSALSMREELYSFHKIYDPAYQESAAIKMSDFNAGAAFVLPDDVRHALVDYSDPWLNGLRSAIPEYVDGKIQHFLEGWEVAAVEGSSVLYIKRVRAEK